MRWKVVLVVGLLMALALFAAAKLAMPPHSDSPIPALPLYLAWAGVAAVGITLATAWLLVIAATPPRAPIYVDRHPAYGMCTRSGNGRAQCFQQLNRPEAADRATELFLGGSALVAAMGAAAFVAIRRTRPPTAA